MRGDAEGQATGLLGYLIDVSTNSRGFFTSAIPYAGMLYAAAGAGQPQGYRRCRPAYACQAPFDLCRRVATGELRVPYADGRIDLKLNGQDLGFGCRYLTASEYEALLAELSCARCWADDRLQSVPLPEGAERSPAAKIWSRGLIAVLGPSCDCERLGMLYLIALEQLHAYEPERGEKQEIFRVDPALALMASVGAGLRLHRTRDYLGARGVRSRWSRDVGDFDWATSVGVMREDYQALASLVNEARFVFQTQTPTADDVREVAMPRRVDAERLLASYPDFAHFLLRTDKDASLSALAHTAWFGGYDVALDESLVRWEFLDLVRQLRTELRARLLAPVGKERAFTAAQLQIVDWYLFGDIVPLPDIGPVPEALVECVGRERRWQTAARLAQARGVTTEAGYRRAHADVRLALDCISWRGLLDPKRSPLPVVQEHYKEVEERAIEGSEYAFARRRLESLTGTQELPRTARGARSRSRRVLAATQAGAILAKGALTVPDVEGEPVDGAEWRTVLAYVYGAEARDTQGELLPGVELLTRPKRRIGTGFGTYAGAETYQQATRRVTRYLPKS